MAERMRRERGESGWRRFWNRGGWWKAVLVAVVYLAVYLGISRLIGLLFGSRIDKTDMLANLASVFFGLTLAVIIGSALLVLFAASLGWLRELFGRQPLRGRWWMWFAPVAALAAAVLRALGTDYSHYDVGVIAMVYATGLFVGFAEELLARGIAVDLLRRRGYSERVVMLLSSLLFAVLHSSNALSGQSLPTVGATVGFASVFGVAMYLTLRVTRSLIWPILLHAVTDPSTILATGGVDTAGAGVSPLATLAALSTFVYLALAVVAIFAVRGRVFPGGAARSAVAARPPQSPLREQRAAR